MDGQDEKGLNEQNRIDLQDLSRKNKKVALYVTLIVCSMVGLAYASVPLYSIFCRVTGYGGTTQTAAALPARIIDREVIVQFDANRAQELMWDFEPEQRRMTVKLGERGLANFMAHNRQKIPVAGTAVFNVTPLKVGKYFNKIQCFCFGEQILEPEQTVHMPVLFFIDPAMNDDPSMDDVKVITLSYSFFKTDSPALEEAVQKFYKAQE